MSNTSDLIDDLADGISSTVFAEDFPANPSAGTSLFIDGTLYQYMTDGTNSAWVDIGTGGGDIPDIYPTKATAYSDDATRDAATTEVGSIALVEDAQRVDMKTSTGWLPIKDLDEVSAADITATGTLPSGAPVILKADGTVEAISVTPGSLGNSISFGSTADSGSPCEVLSISHDPNVAGRFIAAYRGYSNGYGTVAIGNIDGTSITFETPVIFNSASCDTIAVSFDLGSSESKAVVAYRDFSGSYYGKGVVRIISVATDSTVTVGTETIFKPTVSYGAARYISVAADPSVANQFVIAYKNETNGAQGEVIVGEMSGTTATLGAPITFNQNNTTQFIQVVFDPNNANKFLIACEDYGVSGGGGAVIVGTVSGTTASFGAFSTVFTTNADVLSLAVSAAQPDTFVVVYKDNSNSGYATAVAGTISGTSVTLGTPVTLSAISQTQMTHAVAAVGNKFVAVFKGASGYGTTAVIDVSGQTITLSGIETFVSSTLNWMAVTPIPANIGQAATLFTTTNNSALSGVATQISVTAATTNLTVDNFIGTTTDAYADGETANITLKGGFLTNQTGLTVGALYYVQTDGTLAATPASPLVVAGIAVTPTTLLLKGL